MRKLVHLFMALLVGTSATFANTADDKVAERNAYNYNNAFIFVEEGITFAVYPDGEFDFYIDNHVTGRRNNITFNSGFDYSPFAQYDDYGAVIQVENIPIYYDFYGRVNQIGNVDINYRNGRVNRLGNMYVYYNRGGFYDYHTGYINIYNRSYIYRPFHSFFVRPAVGFCLVFNSPYRRYYSPYRYTYYGPYQHNVRHTYVSVGKTHRYNQVRQERETIYRNDKRVTVRDNRNSVRENSPVTQRSNKTVAKREAVSSTGRTMGTSVNERTSRTSAAGRSNGQVTRSESTVRTVTRSESVKRAPDREMVTKRTVRETPVERTTVQRSTSRSAEYSAPSRSSSTQRNVGNAQASSNTATTRSTRSTPSYSPRNASSTSTSRSSSTRSRQ